jgi:hypothetical protein
VTDVRIRRLAALAVVLSASCGQSPLVPFHRAVDQAASWAAAIQYAHQLESRRAVPAAYLKQVVKDGRTAIETVRQTISKADDLPSDLKDEATTLCDQMIGVLSPPDPPDQLNIDVSRLAEIEHALRALVSKTSGAVSSR